MKDTSPVQKLVTWTVVILLVILGISVFMKDEQPVYRPVELVQVPSPTPEIPIYPNNGKE